MSQYLKKLQLLTINSLRNIPAEVVNPTKHWATMDIST